MVEKGFKRLPLRQHRLKSGHSIAPYIAGNMLGTPFFEPLVAGGLARRSPQLHCGVWQKNRAAFIARLVGHT